MKDKDFSALGKQERNRYLASMAALYGDYSTPPQPVVKKKPKRAPTCPTEEQEQIKLVCWLEKMGILHFAIPNAGKRTIWEGAKMKRSGLKSGVPDAFIPVPSPPCMANHNKPYHGLFLELKRKHGGVLSENQKDWLDKLNANGYLAVCVRGFEEAKSVVLDYFKEDKSA